MLKYYTSIIILLLATVLVSSCSEEAENLTKPEKVQIHSADFASPSSSGFHGNVIRNQGLYDLKECQRCHAKNYSGGTTGSSCLNSGCHNNASGPEACNTCHGVFSDTSKTAPPRDLSGGFLNTSRGVGAHTVHLEGGDIGRKAECSWCHIIPTALTSAGHLDTDMRAELVFDSLANHKTGSLTPNPVYNPETLTCANTYCHGYFVNGNQSNTPKWTDASVRCGSCHGSGDNPLPGGTHPQMQNCGTCHVQSITVTITSTDTVYRFTNIQNHVNGVVNY